VIDGSRWAHTSFRSQCSHVQRQRTASRLVDPAAARLAFVSPALDVVDSRYIPAARTPLIAGPLTVCGSEDANSDP
jgi:hypothetical protein